MWRGGEGEPLPSVPLNPGIILVINSIERPVTLPIVIFSHCLFPIVPTAKGLRRPFLYALVKRSEILWGKKNGCYTGKVTQRRHPSVGKGEAQQGTAILVSKLGWPGCPLGHLRWEHQLFSTTALLPVATGSVGLSTGLCSPSVQTVLG